MIKRGYEKMYEICYYNDFDSWFVFWDIVEHYIIFGRQLEEIPSDFKIVKDAYIEVIKEARNEN